MATTGQPVCTPGWVPNNPSNWISECFPSFWKGLEYEHQVHHHMLWQSTCVFHVLHIVVWGGHSGECVCVGGAQWWVCEMIIFLLLWLHLLPSLLSALSLPNPPPSSSLAICQPQKQDSAYIVEVTNSSTLASFCLDNYCIPTVRLTWLRLTYLFIKSSVRLSWKWTLITFWGISEEWACQGSKKNKVSRDNF